MKLGFGSMVRMKRGECTISSGSARSKEFDAAIGETRTRKWNRFLDYALNLVALVVEDPNSSPLHRSVLVMYSRSARA